jgi:hypothetical protein
LLYNKKYIYIYIYLTTLLSHSNQPTLYSMSDRELAELIAELKELKLRELQVLASLESIVQTQHNTTAATSPTQHNTSTAASPRALEALFQVGDRVVITNKIRRPINRPANNGDRTAVVTKVALNRIDIRTSNGSSTWRAPQNLRLRTQDE